jgi:hypothetical protein
VSLLTPKQAAVGFILLNAVDCYLTLRILGEGGQELNPLMAALIAFSVPVFIVGKLVLGFIAAIIIAAERPRLIFALAIGMTLPVAWNLYQMSRTM